MLGLSPAGSRAFHVAVLGAISVLIAAVAGRLAAQTTAFSLESISAGSYHACGITAQHVAYCWGRNAEGELGNPAVTAPCPDGGVACSQKPVRVTGNLAFASISAGNNFTCGITTSGVAYCWGTNAFGQLGNGSQSSSSRPARVAVGALTFQSISAGNNHSCAVTSEGVAYCWGSNGSGKLGAGGPAGGGHTAPVRVAGHVLFRDISAGYFHSCAVARDGRTYCWGRNEQGELGIAAKASSSTPAPVAGASTFGLVHAAPQFDYTCAVDGNGALYCWGANCYGQLGVDSTPDLCGVPEMPCSTRPAAVRAAGPFQSVSGSFSHSCALTATGIVQCWGENNQGQLANGSTGGRTAAPAPIVGGFSYRALSAGREFTCALTADGVPQCWGRNADGQLGVGDSGLRNVPTPVVAP
jgi:alpha-tubulin suppressor-like RCC1 family protein